jgi:hypothetical protein
METLLFTFPLTPAVSEQIENSRWYSSVLKTILVVTIQNFAYYRPDNKERMIYEVAWRDQEGKLAYDKLAYYFIQMTLFNKPESEFTTRQDKWFYFMNNLERFDEIPGILKEPIFEQAFDVSELAKLTPQEKEKYEQELRIFRNYSILVKIAKEST